MPNIGLYGRILRFCLALILLIYSYYFHSWIALLASIFVFIEARFSWCIVYQLLGINTCSVKKK